MPRTQTMPVLKVTLLFTLLGVLPPLDARWSLCGSVAAQEVPAVESEPEPLPPIIRRRAELAALLAEGSARILIELELEPRFVPEGDLHEAAREDQRDRIAGAQNAFLRYLSGPAQQNALSSLARTPTEPPEFEVVPFLAFQLENGAGGTGINPQLILENLEALAIGTRTLSTGPRIKSISPDIPQPPALDKSVPLIRADRVWPTSSGVGQTVAVLDSGVEYEHDFFGQNDPMKTNIVAGGCYSTTLGGYGATSLCPPSPPCASPTDRACGINCTGIAWCEHGTHLAGIVAGNDSSRKPHGVAKDGSLISIQVFSKVTNPGFCQDPAPCLLSFEYDRMLALQQVVGLRSTYNIAAVVMAQSSGAYRSSAECELAYPGLKAMIDTVTSYGIPVVVPTGNDTLRDALGAPSCISRAISVGATNDDDDVAGFSNIAEASFLDLLAPGVEIEAPVLRNLTSPRRGTSMAAAHVAGAWALLRGACSMATLGHILQALQATGKKIDDERAGGVAENLPRIDVLEALKYLGTNKQCN